MIAKQRRKYMENATKALLIAATVLIIIILAVIMIFHKVLNIKIFMNIVKYENTN